MKLKKIPALLSLSVVILLSGCQKDSEEIDSEIEATFRLSSDQAISESLNDDATVVFFEAAANAGLIGNRTNQTLQSTNTMSCATVSVTPQNTFPKTIVIDFGNGCLSVDGIGRSGKITIVLSDSVRKSGSTAVMTFDNYTTAGYKIEGTITWTNNSTTNATSWTREISNGKVISPLDGYYWLHEGVKNVVQTAGANTPLNLLDDVFAITGNHTVTNPAGKSRTATITEDLVKQTICHNVSKGKVKIQGPNHFAIVDYGDGTCDKLATISIDGNQPRNILLP